MEEQRDSTYFGKLQIASDEDIERLAKAKEKTRIWEQALLERVTFDGSPNPRTVLRNRKKNKVARKQRRVNRLRKR